MPAVRRIQPRQFLARAQMPLAIGKQPLARLAQRHAMADGGERILQRAARGHMHVHIAAGHAADAQPRGKRQRVAQLHARRCPLRSRLTPSHSAPA